MDTNLKFELLVLDTVEQSVIQSELNLLNSLLSNGLLWKMPSLDDKNLRITDGGITLEAKRVKTDTENDAEFRKAFLVTVTGNSDWLEPRRKLIVEFLKKRDFDYLYILLDQVSEQIAHELYPLIYRVENLLRAYIVKFMTTRVGSKWWEMTATNELKKKVERNKYNEKVFAQHIDNNAYRIDFGDLGELIYAHSSGFRTREEIISKISQLDETPEAIRKLKEELKSNYQKFFKESFKDKKFQEKWEELEKIRHKVAHNNLLYE